MSIPATVSGTSGQVEVSAVGASNFAKENDSPQQAFVELCLYAACPLCDSNTLVHHRTDDCSTHSMYKAALSPKIQWMRCNACTHIFRNGFYSDDACKILFSSTKTVQVVGNDVEGQRIMSARMVEKVLPYQSSGAWLDVGFGNGSLLFTAMEYGFHPIGLDLRKSSVDAMVRLGIQAFCNDIQTIQIDPKCSVISMADVLEHMPFPRAGLIAAHALLEPGGVLFLSMPNCDSPLWQLMTHQNSNPYWGEIEHCHNFGRRRLYSLLDEVGFEPVRYGVSERYRAGMEVIARKKQVPV